jgi:hypothetical protein
MNNGTAPQTIEVRVHPEGWIVMTVKAVLDGEELLIVQTMDPASARRTGMTLLVAANLSEGKKL